MGASPSEAIYVRANFNSECSSSESISDYRGGVMLTHGRNVSYDLTDPNLPQATQWIIANSNRINLGRIGLKYLNETLPRELITEPQQTLRPLEWGHYLNVQGRWATGNCCNAGRLPV